MLLNGGYTVIPREDLGMLKTSTEPVVSVLGIYSTKK